MARSWPIHVVVLFISLAATVECAGTSISNEIEMKTTQRPVVTTTKKKACGDRWKKYGDSYFSFCPLPSRYIVNTARRKCKAKGAKLAKSKSMAMDSFFIREMKKSYIILGGNDRAKEGVWRWPDKSLMNESYTRWHSGEPDGGWEENCMVLYSAWWDWYSVPCNKFMFTPAGYVCEKKRL